MNRNPSKFAVAALRLLAIAAIPGSCAWAAPLTGTTAVQAAPDPSAPVITTLKAGAEPVPAASQAPAGWMAVIVAGPFEGYVMNRDLAKSLDVKPGSSIYLAPMPDSGVLAVVAKGDKTEITGLHGKWTRVRLDKDLVGFIHFSPLMAPAGASAAGLEPAAAAPPSPSAPPEGSAAAGRPVSADGADDAAARSLPQSLEGRLVSTHNLLPLRRPYDWQAFDANDARCAYLDISKLLLTEQIDRYINHQVEVFGTVKALPNGRDIVIVAESLQLK